MLNSVGRRDQNKPMARLKQGPEGTSVCVSCHFLTKSPYMCRTWDSETSFPSPRNASASTTRSLFPDSSISFHGESPDLDHEISKGKNDERISCLERAVSSPCLLTEEGPTA